MKVLLAGYVLEEGRMSMVHYARVIRDYLQNCMEPDDQVLLDGGKGEVGVPMTGRGLSVKLKKRVFLPLRLRMRKYDLLHIIDSDYAAAIPESKLDRSVVTCHDTMPFLHHEYGADPGFGKAGSRFLEESMRKMVACAKIFTDSEYSRQCILKYTSASPEKVLTVYIGIDANRFRPTPKDDPRLKTFRKKYDIENARVLLHVGAGTWYKNVETVLRVMRKVVDLGRSDAVLVKVGRMTEAQEALAKELSLRERIIVIPKLTDEEIPLAYASADVLLWPSIVEGFGFCALEAMACGLPVVCSNGGSLPEVVGDAALVHAPHDVDGLAASTLRLLEDKSAADKLCEKGFSQITKFQWRRTVEEYYRVYKEIVGEK